VITRTPELICPAGTPAALRIAVEAGADAVYCGFADETNARNFPGLNFSREEMAEAILYAHDHDTKVLVAINSFPRAGDQSLWHRAVDAAAEMEADAVILADLGLCAYAARMHPDLRLHLSVQASASSAEALAFYHENFGIKRAVLPRVLTVEEIADLCAEVPIEMEVFVFGGMCVMAEGRCSLSSYATGKSPNMNGVCSPASHVHYVRQGEKIASQLGEFTINRVLDGEPVGYPTLCKGRFAANGEISYLFDEPGSLNTVDMLPQLMQAGVAAFKIEGRQRSRSYVQSVVSAFRQALDAHRRGEAASAAQLGGLTEGGRDSTGAYERSWR
jgi:collagenase-like PrtC family protease